MARNILISYAYEPLVHVMRVNAYENVDFEEIVLTWLCPIHASDIFLILAVPKTTKLIVFIKI